jgi:DNA-binding GntR family transcriptional regulator
MILKERLGRESAREYAYRMICDNIINLELEPGSRISENELAQEMGLSRTPVREALQELNKIDIVEVYPQRGSFISKVDSKRVEEARFMRLALEKAVFEEIGREKHAPEEFAFLEENVRLEQFYVDENEHSKLMELDNEFHRGFFVIADKVQTYQLLRTMMIYFDRIRSLQLKMVSNQYVVDDHQKMLEALMQGNSALAIEILEEHLTRHRIDYDTLRRERPEYFEVK